MQKIKREKKDKLICPHLHVSQNALECLDLVVSLWMNPEDLISAGTSVS